MIMVIMPQKNNLVLRHGFMQARRLTRRHAHTFFFASLFLAQDIRQAAYAIYSICRLSDDAVDRPQPVPGWETLAQAEAHIAAAYSDTPLSDPLLAAFRATVRRHAIPRDYFDLLREGISWDHHKTRYADFDELYAYCYRVAGVVGLMLSHLFCHPNETLKRHAVDLGIAMQLTNIMRDIREDYARGRIYLPQDEMARYKVTPQDIAAEEPSASLQALLQFNIARARDFYRRADAGIALLPTYRSRLVTALMSRLYAGILTAIERNRYCLTRRAATTGREKIIAALRLLKPGALR